MRVALNFINQSNDSNNNDVVIFQKNLALKNTAYAMAWKVIRNCTPGENHPFTYDEPLQISALDAWGNYTPQLDASAGQSFELILNAAGNHLQMNGPATSAQEIQFLNHLPQGAVQGVLYRCGDPVYITPHISPGQKAVFEFKPTIWIGVVSQVEQSQIMNEAILNSINTEISLLGITKANITMTGGGSGSNATPFQFHLTDVVMY